MIGRSTPISLRAACIPDIDGRLDAAAVDPVLGPVAGEHQVVEAGVVRGQPLIDRPGGGEHVSLPSRDVCPPVLGVESALPLAPAGSARTSQSKGAGALAGAATGPRVAVQELDRVRAYASLASSALSPAAIVEDAAEVGDAATERLGCHDSRGIRWVMSQ